MVFEAKVPHLYALESPTMLQVASTYEVQSIMTLLVPSLIVLSVYPKPYFQPCIIVTVVYVMFVFTWLTSVNLLSHPLSKDVDAAIVFNGGCIALSLSWILLAATAPVPEQDDQENPAHEAYPTAPPVHDEDGTRLTYV